MPSSPGTYPTVRSARARWWRSSAVTGSRARQARRTRARNCGTVTQRPSSNGGNTACSKAAGSAGSSGNRHSASATTRACSPEIAPLLTPASVPGSSDTRVRACANFPCAVRNGTCKASDTDSCAQPCLEESRSCITASTRSCAASNQRRCSSNTTSRSTRSSGDSEPGSRLASKSEASIRSILAFEGGPSNRV